MRRIQRRDPEAYNRVFEVDVGRRRMSRADDDESMKTNDAAKEVFIQRGDESGSGGYLSRGAIFAPVVPAARRPRRVLPTHLRALKIHLNIHLG